MAPTRVLVVDVPRFMAGVLRGIVADHPEFEIVGEVDAEAMHDAIGAGRADVVVLGAEESHEDEAAAVLARNPSLRVVTIHHGGRRATLRRPNQAPREAAEVSQSTLLDMLRGI